MALSREKYLLVRKDPVGLGTYGNERNHRARTVCDPNGLQALIVCQVFSVLVQEPLKLLVSISIFPVHGRMSNTPPSTSNRIN